MSLAPYKKKRSFDHTTEPVGGKSKTSELIFVIQKHDATRLHYDFRLEMGGVLKSWAVPKGPSTDPTVRHLAMMVEDHPFDYKDFEGIIPKGNYGAGTVIVWDYGTYEPIEPVKNKAEAEKVLLKQLKAGSLKIVLHGKKVKGEYALVRIKGKEENAWLLIKHKDKYASDTDITEKDKSVLSGKTIEKMEKSPEKIYKSNKAAATPKKAPAAATSKKAPAAAAQKRSRSSTSVTARSDDEAEESANLLDLSQVPKTPMPKSIEPMLATLVDQPFDEPGWQYEIKWDGYRAVAFCNKGKLELVSRNHKSFNEKFYSVYNSLKALGLQAVLDGEIAVLNSKGATSFGALQNWRSEADGDLVYYVFDILWLNGHDLMGLPLYRRRAILHSILPEEGTIRESRNFETSATEFLAAAAKMGLEGIIAKKTDSEYHPGDRGRDWLKIKVHQRHEVVIGGFTKNDDSPKPFSSLLVGVFEKGKLQYTGKIGTGFSDKLQKEMMTRFKPLITNQSPFTVLPDVNKPSRFRPDPPHASATWLQPKLVCEVSYAEITTDGVMRHPSFEGMREDKAAKDVHAEKARHTEEVVDEKPTRLKPTSDKKSKDMITKEIAAETKPGRKAATSVKSATPSRPEKKAAPIVLQPVKANGSKTLLNPTEKTQVKVVKGHELKFNNLDKVFWPKEGYTKRDLLNYYYQVAPYILPYLKDRPQSLNRFPNGIDGKSFYQKDVTTTAPEWVKQFPYHTQTGEDKNFLVVEDEASLLWMASLGAIEMNPWNSTIQNPDNPDWCIIDLDPTEKNSFDQVIQTAQMTKQVLDGFKVPGYPKTSGSTGIHIYIPMEAKYSYDECQLFGKLIATRVHSELPGYTSIERLTNNRKGKIYVDYLQNRPKATLAAPYSVRPRPGATVSMPLHWEEVRKGLKLSDFNMSNALARVKSEGDLFKPVLGKGIDLKKILANPPG
ncbi:MAG TPA: DNA ligase D [Puia sp.]|nr:DNA ligase D [Puia sp.]